jgi:peptide/nickel transport system permease protein
MLPNALSPVIVITTLNIATFLVVEATIDYLGFGVTVPPTATGGSIMQGPFGNAQDALLLGNWWWGASSGLFLMLTVLAIGFVGDELRDALGVHGK